MSSPISSTPPSPGKRRAKGSRIFRKNSPSPCARSTSTCSTTPRMRQNPRQRCYLCKRQMFTALKKEARRFGIGMVADGTTVSDLQREPSRAAGPGKARHRVAAERRRLQRRRDHRRIEKARCRRLFPDLLDLPGHPLPYDLALEAGLIDAIGRGGTRPDRPRHFSAARALHSRRGAHRNRRSQFEKGAGPEKRPAGLWPRQDFKFVTLDLGGIKSGSWDELPRSPPPPPH